MIFKRKNISGKRNLIFFVIFLLFLIGAKLWQYHWPEMDLVVNDDPVRVLVAQTPWHQYRGLGKRAALPGGIDGMAFLYSKKERYGFVMRDMEFEIDMIWVSDGAIVDIAPNVPLEPGISNGELTVYRPRDVANVVLEFPAGTAEQMGWKIGDRVRVNDSP